MEEGQSSQASPRTEELLAGSLKDERQGSYWQASEPPKDQQELLACKEKGQGSRSLCPGRRARAASLIGSTRCLLWLLVLYPNRKEIDDSTSKKFSLLNR